MTSDAIDYREQSATWQDVKAHLTECDGDFMPPLSSRTDIAEYAAKILSSGRTYEAWGDGRLVGLVAVYLNEGSTRSGFITSVSVAGGFAGRGLASAILQMCIDGARDRGVSRLELKVSRLNARAIGLYQKCGFAESASDAVELTMYLTPTGRNA